MIKVYRMPVPKSKLASMPTEERTIFLQLAHASNEITTLLKLIPLCLTHPSDDAIARQLEANQALVLARLLMGKAKETWDLISRNRTIGVTLAPSLSQQGQEAFRKLRQYFGRANLVTVVRNGYAFHPPCDAAIEAGFQATPESEQWVFYMGEARGNTFHLAADMVVGYAIVNEIDPADVRASFERYLEEARDVACALDDLLGACIEAMFMRHFGAEWPFEVATEVHAPRLSDVMIPFYMEPPAPEDL